VLGYTGFARLTEERHVAISNLQTAVDATATTAQTGELEISPDAAVEIAQTVASGPVDGLEIEWRGDQAFYDIEIGNMDVIVDAQDGRIVKTETDDDDDDDWDDRSDQQAPAPSVTVGEAIRAAEEATSGTVDEVELDYERGQLVYSIEIGRDEVIVDAIDGAVLSVHNDD
jgi:uncharacterized membrane protein YkoI